MTIKHPDPAAPLTFLAVIVANDRRFSFAEIPSSLSERLAVRIGQAARRHRMTRYRLTSLEAAQVSLVDDALDLARRLVEAADAGRVDLGDLGRRARRLLASTTGAGDDD